MAEHEKPKAPVLPFTEETENEWESELADWDAHLPIQDAPAATADPPLLEPNSLGALPDEENPFADTPTTVTSGPPVLDDAAAFEAPVVDDAAALEAAVLDAAAALDAPVLDDAAAFEAAAQEFSERQTPHSDAYAAIIATSAPGDTVFQRESPVETPVPLFADPLVEMAADPWREKLGLMIRVPPRGRPAAPSDDERRASLSLLAAEMEVADTATQQAALTLAAARLSDALGDTDAAVTLCDDALTLQPGSAAALRARLRLAERQGDAARALETVGLLAAAVDGDEGASYRALQAEWTLAMTGALDTDALAALGDGLSRALAEAEIALRAGDPRQAALVLEVAATALEGRAGAALAGLAARLAEIGGDGAAATRQRALAVRFAGTARERLLVAVGQLRDAARAAPGAVASMLDEVLATLPPGDFKVSCARWAAAVARRSGAVERADRLLSDPANGGTSPASLRDRLDLERSAVRTDGGNSERVARVRRLLTEAREIWPARAARACLDVMAAELALAEADAAKGGQVGGGAGDGAAGDTASRRALEIAAVGLEAAPGTVPLAMVAEDVAGRAVDPALRLEALRLWARFDPARAAYAQSLVVDTLAQATVPGGGDEPVRQALGELVAAAPMATAFWALAARERAVGRRHAAADALARGALAWGASELGPALQKLADALRSDAPAPWPAPVAGRGKPSVADPPESVLAGAPADPAALARVTLDAGSDPARLAAIYGNAAAAHGPGEQLWRLQAVQWLSRAGRSSEALEAARSLYESDRPWAPGRALVERLVRLLPDPLERARALLQLGFDAGDPGAALRVAEASEDAGELAGAAAIFRELATGPLAAEGARGLFRLEARTRDRDREGQGTDAAGATGEGTAGEVRSPPALDEARARVSSFLEAARAGRTAEVVERLEREPPHQEVATAPGLYLAGLLRESSPDAGAAADAARLLALAAAGREAARAGDRPGLLAVWRAAEATAGTPNGAGGDALAEIADQILRGDDAEDQRASDSLAEIAASLPAGDPRSSAALLVRAAERDAAAGDGARAETRLRLALERDAVGLPALRALRRALIARGALAEAAALCSREADVLKGRDERIRVLLLAADLGRGQRASAAAAAVASPESPSISAVVSAAVSSGTSGPAAASGSGPFAGVAGPRIGGAPARAADPAVIEPLRRILAIDPAHVGAFEQLREALTAAGEQVALGELLAARIAVATNPFEVAALRLARAELLAGPLADTEGAKTELRAILAKEPQHGKALARLADLQYDSGAFGEAAELYLKRALAERSPERLREIFLRIGRIYTRHEHDAKRAADAYKRVLQLEGENREALVTLSDLLIEIGETKNAIAVTERLVDLTSEVDKRVPYLIRLGQLWEQAGDFRQAGGRFRRAADDAPRNLQAVGEMVRHYDRTRDQPGRRALLDHALLLLRTDLHTGKLDVEVLRALVHVMQWRGRMSAAAAGAQLLAIASSDASDRAAATGWAAPPARGRRLAALARPDIDERLFPAGLPSGVRNIFRIIGEPLAKAVSDLKRYELSRGDRVARGQGPREIVDALAVEMGVKELDVYVKPARAASEPAWLAVEPGEPPTLILGAAILTLGPHAIRFAAARALRLAGTHLDLVLRDTPPQTGALVGGIVRQFVSDYRHPDVPAELMNAGAATVARALSRRVRQEVMPFAMESAGALELGALHEAVRDGANQVGLLASGHLPAALSVVLAVAGRSLSLAHVAANPEALALLDFALSDGYDEICRELEGIGPA